MAGFFRFPALARHGRYGEQTQGRGNSAQQAAAITELFHAPILAQND
jgi:hypothetical protein